MKNGKEKKTTTEFSIPEAKFNSAPHGTGCDSKRMIAQLLFPLIVFPFQLVKNPYLHNDAMNSSHALGCVKSI